MATFGFTVKMSNEHEDNFMKGITDIEVVKDFVYNNGRDTYKMRTVLMVADDMIKYCSIDVVKMTKYRSFQWINKTINRWERKALKALKK